MVGGSMHSEYWIPAEKLAKFNANILGLRGYRGVSRGSRNLRHMNRLLVALGTVLVVAGLLWPWIKKMHFFHLPGDIVIDRPGFKFFFPITTMLIVSVVLSIVAWLMRR
jgi:hypothetical protein